VVIEAQSDGRARAVESVPVGFSGGDRVISFNPHYLLDGLAAAVLTGHGQPAAGGDDPSTAGGRIRLQFTSPAKPALITWVSGDAAAGDGQADPDSTATAAARISEPGDGEPDDPAAFRYLVVPLRTPVAS
jgi:DNA polymerase III sliding clamp (beta) subunit (PCNA family)